jgi:hypothetical protein
MRYIVGPEALANAGDDMTVTTTTLTAVKCA